jgi:hypothetical protein
MTTTTHWSGRQKTAARAHKAQPSSPRYDEAMTQTNKDSGATRMAGAHVFQAVQHPELDTLGRVAICDVLKKRARFLRFVLDNNKAHGVKIMPTTMVPVIDPELLANLTT